MISEVVMPQMGADMTEGTIVEWRKHEGDPVERGEIIAEIETDKANVEIEAFESGVFRKVIVPEGETVDVGTVIAVIASPEEDLAKYGVAAVAAKPVESKAAAPASDQSATPAAPESEQPATPTPAPAAPASDQSATPAAPASEQPATPAPAAPATLGGRVRASPVARKLAQDKGIDLAQVRGTGPDGRIVRRDVEAAVAGGTKPAAPAATPSPAATPTPLPGARIVPMSRMRQAIARRMTQSKQQAPHYYVAVDIDMAEAEHERHEINNAFARKELHVSINDLIVKACAMALARHPMFNSWFVDGQVQQHEAINVCIAIALEDGLIAPAILNCQDKSLAEIAEASRSLVERAKSGALKAEEYAGGTFTISNLGPYDIETLIAIIQPPQAAILGVGSVREVPVVRDGQIVAGKLMKAALSADHRVTDGAEGAQFLNEIRKLLENPAALLI